MQKPKPFGGDLAAPSGGLFGQNKGITSIPASSTPLFGGGQKSGGMFGSNPPAKDSVKEGKLELTVFEAKDLRDCETFGNMNSYCKLESKFGNYSTKPVSKGDRCP